MKVFRSLLIILLAASFSADAQLMQKKEEFTRADSLRGNLTSLRTCYDINYYHLNVKFNIANKYISGSNLFKFTATQDFTKLQFDLYANLKVEKVIYKGKELPFTREFNAVFVTFPATITKGSKDEFTVFYSGNPTIAKNAPWDGGVVYTTDSLNRPWVATACQGAGASIWWPNKDHQADEVDSALISISVPKGLMDISNGRLRKQTVLKDGYTRFDWFVANPINNYDIEANIGNYAHWGDSYNGEKGKLTTDFWVLDYNIAKAKKHFAADVPRMLKAFEYWFGPYPWYEDGYKLIETPHLGMEHQSGVAYGNHYVKGYYAGHRGKPEGIDLSGTGLGLTWDFIIVHESGHEWFGNNITAKDIADMWIHESFTNYSESLFIENNSNKLQGQTYVNGLRRGISNDEPIVGHYNVNKEGSGDMYPKGAVLLNMIRTIINDDDKWRGILRGLNQTFYHKTVTYEDITGYITQQSGKKLLPIFDQYLHSTEIPVIEFTEMQGKLYAKWIAGAKSFAMPLRVRTKGGDWQFIQPSKTFTPVTVPGVTKANLEVDTFNYYIGVMVD